MLHKTNAQRGMHMQELKDRVRGAWCAGVCVACLWVAPLSVSARGPWHAEAENTPGYEQMSPGQRLAHQRRMRGMTRYADCVEYETERRHRSRHRGGAQGREDHPERDPCEELRTRGQLK